MKTIKVIDIYKKIANGEEVPKKIKWKLLEEGYQTLIYNEEEREYAFEVNEFQFYKFPLCHLNDEAEIIEDTPEEDKKIEKLDEEEARNKIFTYSSGSNLYFLSLYVQHNIVNKINEIIDKINGGNNE